MKKLLLGGIVTALLLAGGIGAVWAAEDAPATPKAPNGFTFEEMLPFMKQMHPDVKDETLKEMYNACHSNGGPGGMMGKGMGMRWQQGNGDGWQPGMMRGL